MSAGTISVGYPVHAVARFARWTNEFQAPFTDWLARCGVRGTTSGHDPFKLAGSARKLELCPKCFPGRTHNGAAPGTPEEVAERDQV